MNVRPSSAPSAPASSWAEPNYQQHPQQGLGHCIQCDEVWQLGTFCPNVRIEQEPGIVHLNELGRLTLGLRGEMEERYRDFDRREGVCQCGSTPGKSLNTGSRESEWPLRLHHSSFSLRMLQGLSGFRGPVLRWLRFAHGLHNSCPKLMSTTVVSLKVMKNVTETVSRNWAMTMKSMKMRKVKAVQRKGKQVKWRRRERCV